MRYLGNIAAAQTITFMFSTNDSDGTAVAPTTTGSVSVYKDNGNIETTQGITYSPSFDGHVGINLVTIDTSSSFYSTGHDFTVVLTGAVIDGETINAVLAAFSMENRRAAATLNWATDVANRPTIASKEQVATQVRTELTTELARVDATVSSRLAATGYTTPPAAGDLAAAVLATPANKIASDSQGRVAASNPGGLTQAQADQLTAIAQAIGTLTAAERAAVADALLDRANAIETGKTVRQAMRIVAAVLAGKITGAGTGTETFRGLDGVTTRAVVTTDADANRTNVEYFS